MYVIIPALPDQVSIPSDGRLSCISDVPCDEGSTIARCLERWDPVGSIVDMTPSTNTIGHKPTVDNHKSSGEIDHNS
jgi:hypothetical protein